MKARLFVLASTFAFAFAAPTFAGNYATAAKTDNTIVAVAVGNPDFSTLVAALKAADLVDTLNGTGPFTVFAPTNAAFAKLPKGALDDLLKPENKGKLSAILTYHVVAGKVSAADASKLSSANTVQGGAIAISAMNGTVKINDATVTAADVAASNGVIHVIDTVLMPPAK